MRQDVITFALALLLLTGFGCSESGFSSGGGLLPPKCSKSISGGGTIGGRTIAWDAPAYEDSTPVDGVAGYNIYYGTEQGAYSDCISTGPSTTYSLSQLQTALTGTLQSAVTGTYYFVVTARNADGNESVYSNETGRTF
jgi:hypothetical protein